jgi:hypothetical protein
METLICGTPYAPACWQSIEQVLLGLHTACCMFRVLCCTLVTRFMLLLQDDTRLEVCAAQDHGDASHRRLASTAPCRQVPFMVLISTVYERGYTVAGTAQNQHHIARVLVHHTPFCNPAWCRSSLCAHCLENMMCNAVTVPRNLLLFLMHRLLLFF